MDIRCPLRIIKKSNQWIKRHKDYLDAWSSTVSIVLLPLVILGLVLNYFQIRDYLISPDVTLAFGNSKSVSYKIVNPSDRIAEDVLVSFGIFDLDSIGNGPVPIPTVSYDYVNKRSGKGPFAFLSTFGQPDHRYFGIVYVGCKGCKSLRTYWLYTKYGDGGESFYAERNSTDTFTVNVIEISNNSKTYLDNLIPESRRIYIEN